MFNTMERLGFAALMTIFISSVVITLTFVSGTINLELVQRGVLHHLYVQDIVLFYGAGADAQILQLTHWLASYGMDRETAFYASQASFWLGVVAMAVSINFLMVTLWQSSYVLTRVLTSLVLVASVVATALMVADPSYGGWNILVYLAAAAVTLVGLLYIVHSGEYDQPLPAYA
jgi:hypothetical protein